MRLLVIHQNFPGQFAHLVREWCRRPGWDVRGLGRDAAPGLPGFDGLIRYKLARNVRADQHPYHRQAEASTLHGQATAREMLRLKQGGFTPDVILAHPGWGETLFSKDVFPDARLIHYCEWYYHADGADLGFDPEFPLRFDDRARIRLWNAQHALDLIQCDAAVSPTQWQRSRYPEALQHKIVVQHEGIDTENLGPDSAAVIKTPNGTVLKAGDPVITYVARNLEPYRGFHVFMRALERIQRADSRCHAVIVGGDDTSYGGKPRGFANWREKMLAEVNLDPARTHFMGRIPRAQYIKVLQVSAAHVYLTYPFVLSWSLLEAMACGAPVIASDTAPVREVVRPGKNGALVDFYSADELSQTALSALTSRAMLGATRRQGMADMKAYANAKATAPYDALVFGAHSVSAPQLVARRSALLEADCKLERDN